MPQALPNARRTTTSSGHGRESDADALHGQFPEPHRGRGSGTQAIVSTRGEVKFAVESAGSHDRSALGYLEPRFLRVWRANMPRSEVADTPQDLRHRLSRANAYFARKADEVFIDDASLSLLATFYNRIVIPAEDLDLGEHGTALARLTAANFCEVGANVVYITEAGQLFVNSVLEG